MPIKREYRWLYPVDWPQLTDMVRFTKAGGRCQCCRRPHATTIVHMGDGSWWDTDILAWRNGRGHPLPKILSPDDLIAAGKRLLTTRVYLATAHVDHDPTNNRPRNLKAFCQRCHLAHDRAEHQKRRRVTLFRRKAIGDLFLGLYPMLR